MNEILFFVLAFVIAIFVGTKWKINVGIIAIALTYIASLLRDLDNLNLFTLWPSQLFVMIFAVSVFYSFASINGAMEKLALQIMQVVHPLPQARTCASRPHRAAVRKGHARGMGRILRKVTRRRAPGHWRQGAEEEVGELQEREYLCPHPGRASREVLSTPI